MEIKRNKTKKKNIGLKIAKIGLTLGVCGGALFDGLET